MFGPFLLVLIGVTGVFAVRAWARVFWEQLEPSVRRTLGRRWGIEIEWERTAQRTGWEIRGPDHGRSGQVAVVSVLVWLLGFFAPSTIIIAGVELEWFPPAAGWLLSFLSLLVSLWTWQARTSRQS